MKIPLHEAGLTPQELSNVADGFGVTRVYTHNGDVGLLTVDRTEGANFHKGAYHKPEHFAAITPPAKAPVAYLEGWFGFEACGRRQDNPYEHRPDMEQEQEQFRNGYDDRAQRSPPDALTWVQNLHRAWGR